MLGHATLKVSVLTQLQQLLKLLPSVRHSIKGLPNMHSSTKALHIIFTFIIKYIYSQCYSTECFKTEFSNKKHKEILVILFIAEIKNKLYIVS